MLTTSTHDTKRGEDARARINVLSEIPTQWSSAISRWARANASARTLIRGDYSPDRSDEYLYYQALLGAWPAGAAGPPNREFVDRMRGYMQKAVKEKKTHTSWIHPSPEYDQAVSNFVERSLTGRNSRLFLALFLPFQERIASLGTVNSLSQLTLKIGSPGVPDFYQGSELWDLNLVDPDNRRAVDFGIREQWLQSMEPLLDCKCQSSTSLPAIQDMLNHWQDGRIKLFCTAAGLRLRRRLADVFVGGDYTPLVARGSRAEHIVAFARTCGSRRVLVIVSRLIAGLFGAGASHAMDPTIWDDTKIFLSDEDASRYRNVFTGERPLITPAAKGREIRIADVFNVLPVALLEAEMDGSL